MFKLSRRLRIILDNIPRKSTIIDIGCDHGKLVVAGIIEEKIKSAIATDISAKSLDKTRKLAQKYNILDRIDLRQGDGLDVIKDSNEGDTLIISGISAREIISILDRSVIEFNTYIFTPHQKTPRLREYLSINSYNILSDTKVKSQNKFYDIIVASKGNRILSYKEIMLGKSSSDNKDFIEFLEQEKIKLQKILDNIPPNTKKYKETIKNYNLIVEVINDKSKRCNKSN